MSEPTNKCNACQRERRTNQLEVRREGDVYLLICIDWRECVQHAKALKIWKEQ